MHRRGLPAAACRLPRRHAFVHVPSEGACSQPCQEVTQGLKDLVSCQTVFSSEASNASNCTHKGFSIHIVTLVQHIMGQPIRHCLQGQCSKDGCMYLHKELPASSGVCRAYAAGFCPKGQACTQKHLTPKMLRELRASRTLRAGNAKVRVRTHWMLAS